MSHRIPPTAGLILGSFFLLALSLACNAPQLPPSPTPNLPATVTALVHEQLGTLTPTSIPPPPVTPVPLEASPIPTSSPVPPTLPPETATPSVRNQDGFPADQIITVTGLENNAVNIRRHVKGRKVLLMGCDTGIKVHATGVAISTTGQSEKEDYLVIISGFTSPWWPITGSCYSFPVYYTGADPYCFSSNYSDPFGPCKGQTRIVHKFVVAPNPVTGVNPQLLTLAEQETFLGQR